MVYKYELEATPGSETLYLPEGSKILCVKNQNEQAVIYASVTDVGKRTMFAVDKIMTGQGTTLHKDATFLDTVLFASGAFVLHFFIREL